MLSGFWGTVELSCQIRLSLSVPDIVFLPPGHETNPPFPGSKSSSILVRFIEPCCIVGRRIRAHFQFPFSGWHRLSEHEHCDFDSASINNHGSRGFCTEHRQAIIFMASRYLATRKMHYLVSPYFLSTLARNPIHPSVSDPFLVGVTYNRLAFPMLLYPLSNHPSHVPSFHINIRVSLCIIRPQELQRKQDVAFDEVDVDKIH